MNVLCRNFILSDFCQICSSFFCFFRALSVGTPTFIIEPEKSQISPLKRHGKGSFPVLSPKTPIGIFLFALKSDFQEKSHFASEVPENGEKRRKPEKISGFSVGIFFVNTCWRRHPDSDRRITVLQTVALPLGYVALKQTLPWKGSVLERITGLEPATSTLARWRSTK